MGPILSVVLVVVAVFVYGYLIFAFQEIEDEDNIKSIKKLLEEQNPKA